MFALANPRQYLICKIGLGNLPATASLARDLDKTRGNGAAPKGEGW